MPVSIGRHPVLLITVLIGWTFAAAVNAKPISVNDYRVGDGDTVHPMSEEKRTRACRLQRP